MMKKVSSEQLSVVDTLVEAHCLLFTNYWMTDD